MNFYSHLYRRRLSLDSSGILNANPYEDLSNKDLPFSLLGFARTYILCLRNTLAITKIYFASSKPVIGRNDYLFISYGDQPDCGRGCVDRDRYIGGLSNYLEHLAGDSCLLNIEVPGFKGGSLAIRVLEPKEFFLTVSVGLLDSILIIPYLFFGVHSNTRSRVLRHIANGYLVRTLLWFAAFRRIEQQCPKLKMVIFPMEGATWEFVLSHAMKSECKFIGYLHTFMPSQTSLFRLVENIGRTTRSFRLLTHDRWSYEEILEHVERRVVVKVPAFSFCHNNNNAKVDQKRNNSRRQRLLVIGGMDKIDTTYMVRDVIALDRQQDAEEGIDIIVRFHPNDTVSKALFVHERFSRITFQSNGSIRSALANCDFALISHTSSSSIDALMMNKPFVLYKVPSSQYLNPIPVSDITNIFGVSELSSFIRDPQRYISTALLPFFSGTETNAHKDRLLSYVFATEE